MQTETTIITAKATQDTKRQSGHKTTQDKTNRTGHTRCLKRIPTQSRCKACMCTSVFEKKRGVFNVCVCVCVLNVWLGFGAGHLLLVVGFCFLCCSV